MNKLISIVLLAAFAACAPAMPTKRGALGGIPGGGFVPPTKLSTGGDITAVTVTGPIVGGGTSGPVNISLLSCSAAQILKMNGLGTAWACDSDVTGTAGTIENLLIGGVSMHSNLPAGLNHNVTPTDWATKTRHYLGGDASAGSTITGFGELPLNTIRFIELGDRNSKGSLTLVSYEDSSATGSLGANRIVMHDNAPVRVDPGGAVAIIYIGGGPLHGWRVLWSSSTVDPRHGVKHARFYEWIDATLPSGSTHDWAPTGGLNATRWRITSNIAGSTLTGILSNPTGPPGFGNGELRVLENVGPGVLTLGNVGAGSAGYNSFYHPSGVTITLPVNGTATYIHDATLDGWRLHSTTNPPGGAGVTDGDKGDVTVSASGASWVIDAAAVTLAKMANIPTQTFIGRTTALAGVPEALTATQATAMLDPFTATAKGLAPASGGGTVNYLRADGTYAAPPGAGDITGVTVTSPACSAGSFVATLTGGATGGDAPVGGTCVAEVGDVSSVVAGNGLATGGTSGAVTVDVGAGTNITVNANDVALSTNVVVGGTLSVSSGAATVSDFRGTVISPSVTGVYTAFAPAGIATATVINLQPTGSVDLVGLTTGVLDRFITIRNANGIGYNVTIYDEGGTAAPGDRFDLGGDTHWTLKAGDSMTFVYTGIRWASISHVGRQLPGLWLTGDLAMGVASITGAANYTGTGTVATGALTATGNTTLGDANTDTLNIAAKINANVNYTGAAPTPSACGTTPTMETGSNNRRGAIIIGLGATACTLTFSTAEPWAATPVCTLQFVFDSANTYLTIQTRSATAFSFVPASTTAFDKATGTKVIYHCDGIL